MSRLIDADNYCENICKCNREKCDKEKCPIRNAPPVEAVPVKHGEWDEDAVPFCNSCPLCRSIIERGSVRNGGKLNFCPNCGADMRKKV